MKRLFDVWFYRMNKGKVTVYKASAWGSMSCYGAYPDREPITVSHVMVPDETARSHKIPVSSLEGFVYRNGLWLKEMDYKKAVGLFIANQKMAVEDTKTMLTKQKAILKTLEDEMNHIREVEPK